MGLWRHLRHAHPELAALVAWTRIAYAAAFVAAIGQLPAAARLAPLDGRLALGEVVGFAETWSLALILFGVHLAMLAALLHHARLAPLWLRTLLLLAGIGYGVDGVTGTWSAGTGLARFTFVGEVALTGWLLLRAFRTSRLAPGAPR